MPQVAGILSIHKNSSERTLKLSFGQKVLIYLMYTDNITEIFYIRFGEVQEKPFSEANSKFTCLLSLQVILITSAKRRRKTNINLYQICFSDQKEQFFNTNFSDKNDERKTTHDEPLRFIV